MNFTAHRRNEMWITLHHVSSQPPATQAKESTVLFTVSFFLGCANQRCCMLDLFTYRAWFLLTQAALFCQYLKHLLSWQLLEPPGGLKKEEAGNLLLLEEKAMCESHCFFAGHTRVSGWQVFTKQFMLFSHADGLGQPPNEAFSKRKASWTGLFL